MNTFVLLMWAVNSHHLVRIPLESTDQLRFTGAAQIGSPPRSLRVVFDTGSSDTWVSSAFASAVDKAEAPTSFAIGYGGGVVSGLSSPIDLRLANQLLLSHVHVGFVDDATSVLSDLDAQGVVGLGMEALAQIHTNSSVLGLLAKQHQIKPFVFSLYVSSWSGAKPASQLIIGGQDEALTSSNATWFSFPIVPDSAFRTPQPSMQSVKDSFSFWALRVQSLVLDNVVLPLSRPNGRNGIALLDSGTSVLLLPPNIFDRVVQTLFTRFGTRLVAPSNREQALPACRRCQVHEFPTLGFDFMGENTKSAATSQRFELRGSDYVRCDRRDCTTMIDIIDSSEVSDRLVLVLGSVFFRAYYTRFDYSNKQASIACTLDHKGVCRGGLQPALDYHGQPYEPSGEMQQTNWTGLCVAVTALALLAGFRFLLQH